METISYSQVQDLVLQLPPQRLPAAYEMLRELTEPSGSPSFQADLLRLPLVTAKVMGGIHYEAMRLWLKGAPLYARPRQAHGRAGNGRRSLSGRFDAGSPC